MSNILINPLIARPTGGLKLVLLVLISYMLGMQVNLEPGHSYAEDLDVSMSLPSENGISTERNELFVMNHEPAWPQQDNSIQQAIRGAHRIGVNQTPTIDGTYYMWNGTQCESPPKGMATVVTAYYDLSSKHPRHQYEEWIQNMLWHGSSSADSFFKLVEIIFGNLEESLMHGQILELGNLGISSAEIGSA